MYNPYRGRYERDAANCSNSYFLMIADFVALTRNGIYARDFF